MSKEFICSSCNFKTQYHYFGKKPPFVKSLVMMEDAYIMKDPFSSEGGIIPLGSHCTICGKSVCLSLECSIFYTKRFCVHCVKENISEFPLEIQTEVMKKKNK
ncbi:hypothetical protein ACJMK2_015516 [Sinanodonta woodiana]|uniref:Cysteine-rich DPF motif domain-containing protein 1 n=1 Tax=Sinanodonta woodiana TaxID=1069815 RepID=A0ABD3UQL9_SINWO